MKRQLLFLVVLLFATTITWATTLTVGPGGPPTYNYATIQAAINAAVPGDVISIAPGTYIESNILVNKTLTIQGIGATRDEVIVVPADYDGNVDNAFDNNAQNGFIIKAHSVLIRKLTINGNGNPALTVHANNFRAGIVTLDASQSGGGSWDNLHVDNVVIMNVWRRGISVFPRTVTGTFIENSWIENVAYNQGIYLAGQSQVTYNTIKHCFQGIVLNPDNTTPSTPSTASFKINNNTLTRIGNFAGCFAYPNGQPRAIQFDPVDPVFKTVEIKYNTIDDIGSIGNIGTVGIYTRRASSSSVIDHNVITLTSGTTHSTGAQAVGMLLGWSYTHGFMVSYNEVNMTGYGLGVLVFGAGTSTNPMILERNMITCTAANPPLAAGDATGIYIANQYLFGASNKYGTYVLIQNRNTISGFKTGIDLDKIVTPVNPITVIAHMNSLLNNEIGIDASTMGATVDVIDNYWGASVGPLHPVLNPSGSLTTSATDFDSFIPWWCEPTMTTRCTPVTGTFVIMNLNTGVQYYSNQLALALLQALDGHSLLITGTADATTIDAPVIGTKTVTIVGTGTPGASVIAGASTLSSGNLIIKDIEFTNTTDAPTILVTGGALNLRKCTINETSGGTQAGLKVTGGIVDAGTFTDYGYNKFLVSSPGSAIDNTSVPSTIWYAVGNNWGSPSGPTVATNPGGTGAAILNSVIGSTDYVIYRPWGGITMSGTFKYYNLANTVLTSDITVKLYQDNLQVGTDYAVTAGNYTFSDLVMGDYEVRTTSTKSVYGSVNATDAAQVNAWYANPYMIEKVRFYAGDVTGSTFFINSTDALRIQKNFVFGTSFDRLPWTFWETGKTISSNTSPTESYPIVTVGGSNKTANMYGLATGDFNRSFTPSLKSTNDNVTLNYAATRQISAGQTFDLPIRIVNATGVGAVSLILNFPADLVEVQDVFMNATGGQLDWTVKNNELRIGWNTQIPVTFASLDNLLTLQLKAGSSFTKGNSIRISLAADPLNELANQNFDVIGNATLNVDVVEASPNGIENQTASGLLIRNYPNPFAGQTVIAYTLPSNGTVTIEICNMLGTTVKTLVNEFQLQGNHSVNFDARGISAGVYTATIKLTGNTDTKVSTIKIVNNR